MRMSSCVQLLVKVVWVLQLSGKLLGLTLEHKRVVHKLNGAHCGAGLLSNLRQLDDAGWAK